MHSSGCILQGIVNRQVGVFYCRREFSCLVWNKKSACLQLFYFCLQFHFKTPFTPGHFGIARNLKTQVQAPLFSMAPKMCCCRSLHHNPGISHGMKLVTQKKLLLLFGQQASCYFFKGVFWCDFVTLQSQQNRTACRVTLSMNATQTQGACFITIWNCKQIWGDSKLPSVNGAFKSELLCQGGTK